MGIIIDAESQHVSSHCQKQPLSSVSRRVIKSSIKSSRVIRLVLGM